MTATTKRRRATAKPDPEQNALRLLRILEQNLATSTEPALRLRLLAAIATLKGKRAA